MTIHVIPEENLSYVTLAKNDNVGENAGKNYQVKLSWDNSDLQN